MSYLSVKNWDEFQQYKDRDPKWIKLHRDVLDDYEFDGLTEIQQCHLVKIWLLSAKLGNKIPSDAKWIARKIGAQSKVDIDQLVTSGFLCPYKSVHGCTETYLEEETEAETEAETKKEADSCAPSRTTSRFDEFWQAYPVKRDKKKARDKWKTKRLDGKADLIISDVENRKARDGQWLDGYIPLPTTYLNGERWEDEISPPRKNSQPSTDDVAAAAVAWRKQNGQ